MWSSTVFAHLPQVWANSSFWDAFLLTMVVKRVYLCYNMHFGNSNQYDYSSLTSRINKVFPPAELQLTGFFYHFTPFCVNSRDVKIGRENPQEIRKF